MNREDLFQGLSGKTVGGIVETHIQQNAKIFDGKIVFEPIYGGIRVTARDETNKTLWGFVASPKMIGNHYCPVGLYVTLKEMISEELESQDLSFKNDAKQVEYAKKEIENMQAKLADCIKKLNVKKETKATMKNAQVIYKALHDANILLESDLTQMKISLQKNK